jgi:hypothetical protein
MNQFDDRGPAIGAFVYNAPGNQFGGKENEHGTHLFPLAVYDIVGNPVKKGHFGRHGLVELFFKKLHFLIDRLLYLRYDFHHCSTPDKIAGKFGFFGLVKLIKFKG